MENNSKIENVGLNPYVVEAKRVAHWFIYMYDIVGYTRTYVDKRLNKWFEQYKNNEVYKTTVLCQIIGERKNIEKKWTPIEKVEKDWWEINKKLNELLKVEKS